MILKEICKIYTIDGLTWTFTQSPQRMSQLLRIIWTIGQIIALHHDNGISRSTDAITWTYDEVIVVDEMVNPTMYGIAWNETTYVAAGAYGYIYTSRFLLKSLLINKLIIQYHLF